MQSLALLKRRCRTSEAHLPVAPQAESVVTFPGLPPSCSCLVEFVALAQTTRLLASGSQATGFAVLVDY